VKTVLKVETGLRARKPAIFVAGDDDLPDRFSARLGFMRRATFTTISRQTDQEAVNSSLDDLSWIWPQLAPRLIR
jgi:hypothetical protein